MQVEFHRFIGGEVGFVRVREVDIDAVLQLAEQLRGQLRGPLFAIAEAVLDLRFREKMLQIQVVNERLELFRRCRFDEKLFQVTPHERFIGADPRQQRDRCVVRVQVGGVLSRFDFFEEILRHVTLVTRQR